MLTSSTARRAPRYLHEQVLAQKKIPVQFCLVSPSIDHCSDDMDSSEDPLAQGGRTGPEVGWVFQRRNIVGGA